MFSMTDSGHRHHAIDYIELTVTDSAAAQAFYAAAFGWQFNDYGPAYAGIANPGGPDLPEVGGLATSEVAASPVRRTARREGETNEVTGEVTGWASCGRRSGGGRYRA